MGNTDSKVTFRNAVVRLLRDQPVPEADRAQFFAQFWNLPSSADDVWTLLPPQDLRRLRDDRPVHFVHLCHAVTDQFLVLANDKAWTSPNVGASVASSLASSVSSLVGGARPSTTAGTGQGVPALPKHAQLLNCVRLLTRLIAFVFDAAQPDLETATLHRPVVTGPLYRALLDAILSLLFREGFTLFPDPATTINHIPADGSQATRAPPSADGTDDDDDHNGYRIWERGLGRSASVPVKTSAAVTAHRTEMLRLLLVLCSKSMFTPAPSTSTPPASQAVPPTTLPDAAAVTDDTDPYLTYLTCEVPSIPMGRDVLCSLLNTVTAWQPTWLSYEGVGVHPAGMGVAGMADTLVLLSLHVLCVIFTRVDRPGTEHERNQYVALFSRIADTRPVAEALIRLLASRRKSSLLPGAAPAVPFFHEILVLIFCFMHCNESFYDAIDSADLADQLIPELLDLMTRFNTVQEVNLLRIAIQVLASLSLKQTQHTDAIIQTLHGMMTRPSEYAGQFYELFLGILHRALLYHPVSPEGARAIVQLACVMGQPGYIAKGEHNWKLAAALFDEIELGLNRESRAMLDQVMSYYRELSQFVFVQPEQLESPIVGKGKEKKRSQGWEPSHQWFASWRPHIMLPQLEHVLVMQHDGPKSLEDIAGVLMTMPKSPQLAAPHQVHALQAGTEPPSLDGRYHPPTAVRVWLVGFVWGACFLRHKPGERSVGLWHGTSPRRFKVQVVGPAAAVAGVAAAVATAATTAGNGRTADTAATAGEVGAAGAAGGASRPGSSAASVAGSRSGSVMGQ
ncbi:hypothetical protein GGF31_002845 [Allomyces arbusculus]|nr:hypothetical protein GGF31_002845 [Allomyces arbusculus]